jgi:hypothetical protein
VWVHALAIIFSIAFTDFVNLNIQVGCRFWRAAGEECAEFLPTLVGPSAHSPDSNEIEQGKLEGK